MTKQAGYNVGTVRWKEFAKHVRLVEGGSSKTTRFGELKFFGNRVFSYDMLIGKIWPDIKVIVVNLDAEKISKTTKVHVRAVTNSIFELKDYRVIGTVTASMEQHPKVLLQNAYFDGKEVDYASFLDALSFYTQWKHSKLGKKNIDEGIKEYLSLKTQEERDSMRCLLELAAEDQ